MGRDFRRDIRVFGTELSLATFEEEETEDAETDDDADETQETSIADVTQTAAPEDFDQTFLSSGAALDIDGQFDPVPGPKQVIPRVGYTINFNFVYNEARDRWEPDTGNGNPGAAGTKAFQTAGTGQSLNGKNVTEVTLNATAYDTRNEANLSNNEIVVSEDGLYYVGVRVGMVDLNDGDNPTANGEVNGTPEVFEDDTVSKPGVNQKDPTVVSSDILQLSAGDSVSVSAGEDITGGHSLAGGDNLTALTVVQV